MSKRPAELDDKDRRALTDYEEWERGILFGNPLADPPRGIIGLSPIAVVMAAARIARDEEIVNAWLARNWERPWQK